MAGGVLLEGGQAQVRLVGRLVGLAPGFVGIKRLDDPGGQEAGHDPPQTADGAEDDGAVHLHRVRAQGQAGDGSALQVVGVGILRPARSTAFRSTSASIPPPSIKTMWSSGCVGSIDIGADLPAEGLGHRRAAHHDLHLVADSGGLHSLDHVLHDAHGGRAAAHGGAPGLPAL